MITHNLGDEENGDMDASIKPRDKFEAFLFDMLDVHAEKSGASGVNYQLFQKAVDDWKMSSSPYAHLIYGDCK